MIEGSHNKNIIKQNIHCKPLLFCTHVLSYLQSTISTTIYLMHIILDTKILKSLITNMSTNKFTLAPAHENLSAQ